MKLTLLALPCVAFSAVVSQSESPVKRVIGLLEKMKTELTAEADNDAKLYDQMVCWCETSEKDKTLAVANAEATIKDLQSEIEMRSARFGELATDIVAMKKQIAEDTAALKEATALREKEAAAFRGDEKDSVQAITNLKNAVRVLGKHQGGSASLVQISAPELSGLRVVLRDVALKHELMRAREPHVSLLSLNTMTKIESDSDSSDASSSGSSLSRLLLGALDTTSESDEQLPLKFAEKILARSAGAADKTTPTSFLQVDRQPTNSGSYSSASDGIFGILSQMLDEFQADLKTSQDGEAKASADFASLEKAKTEQIAVGKQKLDELEGDHAGNQKALSDAKENIQLTTEQRAADVEFLRNLKLTCNDLDAQWEARSKSRSEEITAVAETIKILTDDDNAEQLKAGGVFAQKGFSFIEVEEAAMRKRRSKAANALRAASKSPDFDDDDLLAAWKSRSQPVSLGASAGPRSALSALAVSVSLDSFTKVKALMDDLVAQLKVQQKEEVDFKAYCTKELDENEKATFEKSEQKEDHETSIKKLTALMEQLASEIADAQEQIAQTQLEVKKASQAREDENAAFQQVVSDQRATQTILAKALQRLKDFYAKRLSGFVQVNAQQTPPVHFKPMGKSAGASPVMGLIEQIVEDSKALEKEAITAEYQAQADYENMVKDSNTVVKDLEDAISSKNKASAQAKIDLDTATADLGMADDELESLSAYEADLHGQCDFVLKNFDIRQKARLQEMEAIGEAKAILSGSR
jgi:hypothetical protein